MGSQTRTAERERVVERAGARASRLFRHRRRLVKLSYPYDESARVNERDSVGHFEKFVPKMCWMDLWHCRLRGMKRCSPSYRSGGRRRRSYFCLFPAPFRIPRRRRCSASAEALQRNAPGFLGCTRLNCDPSHAMGSDRTGCTRCRSHPASGRCLHPGKAFQSPITLRIVAVEKCGWSYLAGFGRPSTYNIRKCMSLLCVEQGFVVGAVVSVVVDATQHNSFRPGAEVQVVVRMRHVMTPCGIEYTLQTTRRSGYLTFPFSSAAAWPS